MRVNRRNERGAAAVEFALVAPIVFLLIAALMVLGLSALFSGLAQNAAREAARFASIRTGASSSAPYPTVEEVKRAAMSSVPGFVPAPVVEVQNNPSVQYPGTGDIVTVTTTYDVPVVDAMAGFFKVAGINLSGLAVVTRSASARRE